MLKIVLIVVALFCVSLETVAQDTTPEMFGYGSFNIDSYTLPYRYIAPKETKNRQSALVIFLHGRHASGTDNVTPVTRKVIRNVADFVQENIYAHYLVPQCPYNRRWGEQVADDGSIGMSVILKHWIDDYIKKNNIDSKHIYIMGVSLGGGGVWRMLSDYPDLFTSAIAVASTPRRINPKAIAKTPLLCIVGEDDELAIPVIVKHYVDDINEKNKGSVKYVVLDDMDHGQACRNAFTDKNLKWLFRKLM